MFSRAILQSSTRRSSFQVSSWRRSFATETNQPIPSSNGPPPSTSKKTKKTSRPQICAAVVVNRSPFLTRSLSPFEQAYHAYQARIRRALHNPFPIDFYFKQGSLLETRFNLEEDERERLAFGNNFIKDDGVNSEKAAADKAAVEQLAEQEGEGEGIVSRDHYSSENANVKSLDRQGERNLYLLLRTTEGDREVWRFPQGGIEGDDLLHQAAQKDLYAECGESMDTWIVSRNPVGVYKPSQISETAPENVVFFFKAHIMAGQAEPRSEQVKDFAWLTKEEIKPLVDGDYWEGIKDMLSDY